MSGNNYSRHERMGDEIKELRAKIMEIQLIIVTLKHTSDPIEKERSVTKIKIKVHDLEEQLNKFCEEYRKEIATRDGFLGLFNALKLALNLKDTSSLEEIQETDQEFSKVDALLLNYLRKHFGSTELTVNSVSLGGRAGPGTNVLVKMEPKKRDTYDEK